MEPIRYFMRRLPRDQRIAIFDFVNDVDYETRSLKAMADSLHNTVLDLDKRTTIIGLGLVMQRNKITTVSFAEIYRIIIFIKTEPVENIDFLLEVSEMIVILLTKMKNDNMEYRKLYREVFIIELQLTKTITIMNNRALVMQDILMNIGTPSTDALRFAEQERDTAERIDAANHRTDVSHDESRDDIEAAEDITPVAVISTPFDNHDPVLPPAPKKLRFE